MCRALRFIGSDNWALMRNIRKNENALSQPLVGYIEGRHGLLEETGRLPA